MLTKIGSNFNRKTWILMGIAILMDWLLSLAGYLSGVTIVPFVGLFLVAVLCGPWAGALMGLLGMIMTSLFWFLLFPETRSYVYYVGAHSGCGCGFAYGRNPEYEEDIEENRGSVIRLSQYLTKAVEHNETIELFACWEGDQAEQPVKRGKATPSDMGGESFWFEEREFLLIAL